MTDERERLAALHAEKRSGVTLVEPSTDLSRVRPGHVTYARMRAKGVSVRDAARELGVTASTAKDWERRAWWPTLVERERRYLLGDVRAVLEPHIDAAIETLARLAREGDRESAKYLVDQFYGRPIQRVQSDIKVESVDGEETARLLQIAMSELQKQNIPVISTSTALVRALPSPSGELEQGSHNDDSVTQHNLEGEYKELGRE